MKKVTVALLTLLLGFNFAKAQISQALQVELEKHPNKLHAVSISYPSFIDFSSLKADFEAIGLTSAQRAKIVNRLLLQQANTWQANTHQILRSFSGDDVGYVHSFYIVNRVVANLSNKAITRLASLPEVQSIELALGDLIFDEPVESFNETQKTAGATGPEAGLIAINAPAMWALGYTGRARKVYVYDTGVWPTHPAFSHRFLGNYNPMNEAWYGHFSDVPTGIINSHGTHVLGTTAGLDTATNDTIGVAFGAYWMACDLINGSTAAGLPDQVYLIGAFEWALNPDGDTNTTDDIPDVINNSWRWRDIIDTAECNGMIPQLMNAIEAAGIANIFSGGNTGPSNVGVNSPQRINTSEVNTFTVGSVNANTSFPYPISSFSTRGPTQCAGTGSLKIHPEVSAPGQNVRSAWGVDSYNSISGTSMASPHVSGAVLLLKEAFPFLSGEVLLKALYDSAIDLGPVGEDNTYGRGLIDVFAAYQLLAQTNTPVNPNAIKYDLAIKDVSRPLGDEVICDSIYNPVITLINLGDSAINSVALTVYQNGIPVYSNSTLPTPGLNAKGAIQVLNMNFQFPLTSGNHIWVLNVNSNKNEFDLVNNERYIRFRKLSEFNLPLLEDFENGIIESKWTVINPDQEITWDTTSIIGIPGNTTALKIDLSHYQPRQNQKDELRSHSISLPSTAQNIGLGFDVAYQPRTTNVQFHDTLRVWISEDCGASFSLYSEKYGSQLSSTNTTGALFQPTDSSDWRRDNIDISALAGKSIVVSFESVNRLGSDLYLDNISVYAGPFDPVAIRENNKPTFKLYPNPANDVLNIEIENAHRSGFEIEIVDVNGRVITRKTIDESKSKIDVSGFADGVYFISLKGDQTIEILKFVKL